MKRFIRIALPLAVLILLVLIFPLGVKLADASVRSEVDEQIFLFRESDKLNLREQDSIAIRLWKFVASRIRNPALGEFVQDTGWTQVLASGMGSCDQQAMILIRLARSYDLDGRLIFLRGQDSVSRHSVAELKIKGKWAMFDPFYGVTFHNQAGALLGVEELLSRPVNLYQVQQLPGHGIPDIPAYRQLFTNRYPFIVFKENQLKPAASFWYKSARFNSFYVGNLFDRIWDRYK